MAIEGYRSNPLLKAANQNIEFTEEQIKEYIKCGNDPIYFIENYVKIVTKDHGLQLFKLFEYQKRLIRAIQDNRFSICLCPRQYGKSETIIAYILWLTLFNEDYYVGILANKGDLARKLVGRYQKSYENLPKFLQQGILEFNKGSLSLENGSKLFASGTTKSGIRGDALNLLYCDEFAWIEDGIASEFYASVLPTITSGASTKMVITSTPRGTNLYYKLWNEAEQNSNDFYPIRVYWYEYPGRNQDWADELIKKLGQEKFDVEFGCSFLGSSDTLISGNVLAKMTYKDPIKQIGDTLIFIDPIKESFDENGNISTHDHIYFMTVDVSEGIGQDYHAFSVFDCSQIPYVQVARYRNNTLEPILFPSIIKSIATYYNMAYVLIEINKMPQVAQILVHDEEYENVLRVSTGNAQKQTIGGYGGRASRDGINMSPLVKRSGCTQLKTLIENDKLIINDFETKSELTSFIRQKNSYSAESGKHDDLCMVLVIFSWLTNQDYFKDLVNSDIRKQLKLEKFNEISDYEMLPEFEFVTALKSESFIESGVIWDLVIDD